MSFPGPLVSTLIKQRYLSKASFGILFSLPNEVCERESFQVVFRMVSENLLFLGPASKGFLSRIFPEWV